MKPRIEELLRELGAVVDALRPGWSKGWNPGLSRAQVEEALRPLEGWRPPEEILSLYEWRDGQSEDEEHAIWPPFALLPLERAVAMYTDLHKHLETMPPLLAIGYGMKTNLEVPLSREPRESQPLYHRDNEGQPFLAFNGLEGLLRAAIDGFREGHFRWNAEHGFWERADESEVEVDEEAREAIHAVRLRHNPGTSPTLWDEENEECGRLWIDQWDASTWPAEWQGYIGFDAEAFQPQGATATITDVVLGRVDWTSPVIVHSIVEGLVGGGSETRVSLGDGVQSIEVICQGVHASGIVIGDRFEFELERPLTKGEMAERRRQDEAMDKAIREQVRMFEELHARQSGEAAGQDEIRFADVMSTLGGADTPIFVAKRVALIERDPEPEGAGDEYDEGIFRHAGQAAEPSEDVPGLARELLESYHAGYRTEHKFREVSLDQIPEIDMRLYDDVDAQLAKAGFTILGAYEIANMRDIYPGMPRVAMRSFSDGKSIMGAFYSLPKRMWASMIPPRKPPKHGIVDLLTQFEDGRVVLTSSAGDALKYEAAPNIDRVMLPIGASLDEVLGRHRERIAKAPGKAMTATTMKDYLALLRGRHKAEREFALGRVPTPAELVRLGSTPDLANRIHAEMKKLQGESPKGGRS